MSRNAPVWLVIPARGGSKGIPHKNLSKVGGHPLVGRAVRIARQAQHVDRVIVSTDSQDISGCARQYGAEVIQRPADISGDTASSEDTLFHLLEDAKAYDGASPSVIAMLQCTAPFTTAEDIDGTLDALVTEDADSAFAAVEFEHFLWKSGNGGATPINHEGTFRQRRQDIAPQYLEAGSVYAMRVAPFLEQRHRFCGKTGVHLVPQRHCFEIDTPFELAVAQQTAHIHDRTDTAIRLPHPVGAVVFDFDGVFTDNAVWVREDGTETVRCSRGDGFGLGLLKQRHIPLLVLSKERNPVVQARCRKLDIPLEQGVDDKATYLTQWLNKKNIDVLKTVYIGNDINDVACMELAGCAVAPVDGHPDVRKIADIVLHAAGGQGAVRELCDLLLAPGRA